MELKEKNIRIYKCAYEYLLKILPESLTENDLEKYFIGDNSQFSTLKDVFIRIICSAQNYQRMLNVIKFNERYDVIRKILFDFDFNKLSNLSEGELYQIFRKELNVNSKDSKMNSWYKWSCSIIDSANFIKNFKDVRDFKEFVKLFDYNTITRMSLPLLISSKIRGIGFALACDLLKELGYLNYPKPDVDIIDIFTKLDLSDSNPINVFEAVVRMAEDSKDIDSNATLYKLDKMLWLISSGKFYLDNITISRNREDFISFAQKEMDMLIYN